MLKVCRGKLDDAREAKRSAEEVFCRCGWVRIAENDGVMRISSRLTRLPRHQGLPNCQGGQAIFRVPSQFSKTSLQTRLECYQSGSNWMGSREQLRTSSGFCRAMSSKLSGRCAYIGIRGSQALVTRARGAINLIGLLDALARVFLEKSGTCASAEIFKVPRKPSPPGTLVRKTTTCGLQASRIGV